jgi:ABC-type multidrug transport system ATPase subunit
MVGHGLRVDEYLRFVARVRASRGATEVSAAADAARRAGLEPSAAIAMLTAQQCAALAIAAAVVANVSAILIDEAVDALTFAERERVTSWLVEIRDRGVAMLVATKDADVQKTLCHRVLRLVRGRVAEERRLAAATAGAAAHAVSSVGSL